jgi:hypothetical protein
MNYQRDGFMRFDDNFGGDPNYWPNGLTGRRLIRRPGNHPSMHPATQHVILFATPTTTLSKREPSAAMS